MDFYWETKSLFKDGNGLISCIVKAKSEITNFGVIEQVSNASRITPANIVLRDIMSALQNSLPDSHGREFSIGNIQIEKDDFPS